MTLKEMREKMANLLVQARAKRDELNVDGLTEGRVGEIESQYDAIMAEYDALQAKHDREKALVEAEARQAEAEAEAREARRPGAPDPQAEPEGRATERPAYADVFMAALRSGAHTLNPEQMEVFAAVQRGMAQDQVQEMEARAMSVGTPSEGGYFVPDEFSGMLVEQLEDWGAMYSSNATAQISTSGGNSLLIPTLDYTAERGELHAENGAVTDDGSADPVIGQKQMDAYIYNTPIVPFSLELLNDSEFAIEPLLARLFGQSLGRTSNDVLTNGDGSNKPQGILTGATTGETAQSATIIDPDEIINLVHSVDPAYRRSPMTKFQFNDQTLAVLRKLKDGQDNYLWQMGDVRTGEPNTLLGHPYMINSAMPDVGTGDSPILFGDHSQYMVRKVGNFSVVPFREKFMNKLQIGLMAFMRFDGEILNSSALKKLTMA